MEGTQQFSTKTDNKAIQETLALAHSYSPGIDPKILY